MKGSIEISGGPVENDLVWFVCWNDEGGYLRVPLTLSRVKALKKVLEEVILLRESTPRILGEEAEFPPATGT